jgi:gliding motility-associated lipoprotein GldD
MTCHSKLSVSLGILFVLLAVACTRDYQPKPKGYNRFVLPEPAYVPLPDSLPYFFEYSAHARLLKDTSWIRDRNWVEIYYPQWKANIHVTYYRVHGSEKKLKELMGDAYTLTAKHQIKASGIDETLVRTPNGKLAIVAEISGEVPSPFQITMTDSAENFLRTAFYFNTRIQNDSLQPVMEYVKKDMLHMVNTLRWKLPSKP